MRHITQLKDDYKKNPEKTQEKYDQEINAFIDQLMIQNKKKELKT